MEELSKKFEQFLNKNMTSDEYIVFKNEIENDEELLEAFKDHVLLKQVNEYAIKKKARSKAQEVINKHREKKIIAKRRILLITIACIATALILLFFIFKAFTKTPQSLPPIAKKEYIETGKIYSDLTQPLRNLSVGQSTTTKVMLLLDAEDFATAIEEIDKFPSDNADYDRMQLIQGWCHLQINNYDQALNKFQNFSTNNPYLTEEAEWLEVITRLISDPESTKEIKNALLEIKNKNAHKYQKEANRYYEILVKAK